MRLCSANTSYPPEGPIEGGGKLGAVAEDGHLVPELVRDEGLFDGPYPPVHHVGGGHHMTS